jgi:predicted CoA-substrate-specific enzyme activase
MPAYVAGVDIGASSTKAVLLDEAGAVRARTLRRTGADLALAGAEGLAAVVAAAGALPEDVAYVSATGYGRYQMEARDIQITEITCHARGAFAIFPGARTVIDVGAQNTRAIALTPEARVAKFKMSERCAAGAGRFFERVAKALELEVADLSQAASASKEAQPISSICAVLAESEIINLVTEGRLVEDIVMGANQSIADRVVALARQVGAKPPVAVTGGVSMNATAVKTIESRLGMPIQFSADSPYAGALGAALLGRVRLERRGAGARLPAGPAGAVS